MLHTSMMSFFMWTLVVSSKIVLTTTRYVILLRKCFHLKIVQLLLNFFPQMLGWNVGGVYLVACAFQALILLCAAYTLLFLKSAFIHGFLFPRSLILWLTWFNSSWSCTFRRQEWRQPEPNVVTTSYSQYKRHWNFLAVQTLLKFSPSTNAIEIFSQYERYWNLDR